MKRRTYYTIGICTILFTILISLAFRVITTTTGRYYAAISKNNEASRKIIGTWQRAGRKTNMIVNPDGTGVLLASDGTEVHFDWTCDGAEFHLVEYDTPIVWLVKIQRIMTMDTSMTGKLMIVTLNEETFELQDVEEPTTVFRYDRVQSPLRN